MPPSHRIFGEYLDLGPPENHLFKRGQELQVTGGYDLDYQPLKELRARIKVFHKQQHDDLVNSIRNRDTAKQQQPQGGAA